MNYEQKKQICFDFLQHGYKFMKNLGYSRNHFFIVAYLSTHISLKNECFPSINTIADGTGLSEREVKRCIKLLTTPGQSKEVLIPKRKRKSNLTGNWINDYDLQNLIQKFNTGRKQPEDNSSNSSEDQIPNSSGSDTLSPKEKCNNSSTCTSTTTSDYVSHKENTMNSLSDSLSPVDSDNKKVHKSSLSANRSLLKKNERLILPAGAKTRRVLNRINEVIPMELIRKVFDENHQNPFPTKYEVDDYFPYIIEENLYSDVFSEALERLKELLLAGDVSENDCFCFCITRVLRRMLDELEKSGTVEINGKPVKVTKEQIYFRYGHNCSKEGFGWHRTA